MVEVMGMVMEQTKFDALMEKLTQKWETMDEWDKDYYEDFEDFVEMELHSHLYSEE